MLFFLSLRAQPCMAALQGHLCSFHQPAMRISFYCKQGPTADSENNSPGKKQWPFFKIIVLITRKLPFLLCCITFITFQTLLLMSRGTCPEMKTQEHTNSCKETSIKTNPSSTAIKTQHWESSLQPFRTTGKTNLN